MAKPQPPNAPKPLTATPPAQLDFSRPEAPVSTEFDDVYFSVDNGLEETRQVYLQACGLPGRWAGRTRFCIGELGFGTGLNFLAVWQMWRAHRPSKTAQLYFASVEGFPLSRDELKAALAQWEELSDFSAQLTAVWPDRVKGQHSVELSDGVTLILCHDAVEPALGRLDIQADCWFLDGFSPAKNPDMWALPVMERIFTLSAPGAQIGTFTVAGHVRRSLSEAGFEVSKQPGFGRKRERLEAVKPEDEKPPYETQAVSPLIIGAGIAGASLARAFLRLGITPTVIDAGDDSMASANPAAIVKPRLDLQDRPESRFFLSAYLYALGAYGAVPEAIISRGVPHSARRDDEMARFKKLCAQALLPPCQMRMMSAQEIGQACGLTPKSDGLWFDRALAFDPNIMRAAFMEDAAQIEARAHKLQRKGDMWQILDEAGQIIAEGAMLILAGGAGLAPLLERSGLSVPDELVYLRGQVTWSKMDDSALTGVLTYGGYAIPKGDMLLLGASHGRTDEADLKAISAQENQQNLDEFYAATGEAGFDLSADNVQARAAMRVSGFKTLPRIGRIRDGALVVDDSAQAPGDLHILTGLGGRGFSFAPLMAAHMVTRLCGGPSFLASDARERLILG